jgi:hypothetical protein
MVKILLTINAGKDLCNDCEHLSIFSTGLIGESHPVCGIFGTTGDWGDNDMKRAKECLKAANAEFSGAALLRSPA